MEQIYNLLLSCENNDKGYINITNLISKYNNNDFDKIYLYSNDMAKLMFLFDQGNDMYMWEDIKKNYVHTFNNLHTLSYHNDVEYFAFSLFSQNNSKNNIFASKNMQENYMLPGPKIQNNNENETNEENKGKCFIFDQDDLENVNLNDDVFITFGTEIRGIFKDLYQNCNKVIKMNEGGVNISPVEEKVIDGIYPKTCTLCSGIGPKTLGIVMTALTNIRNKDIISRKNVIDFINKNILANDVTAVNDDYLYHTCYLRTQFKKCDQYILALRIYYVFVAMLIIKYIKTLNFDKKVYIFVNKGISNIYFYNESYFFLTSLVNSINKIYTSHVVEITYFEHNQNVYKIDIKITPKNKNPFYILIRTFDRLKNSIKNNLDVDNISFLEFVNFFENIVMTTGDLSFQECVALGKIVYHDYTPHKISMVDRFLYSYYQYLLTLEQLNKHHEENINKYHEENINKDFNDFNVLLNENGCSKKPDLPNNKIHCLYIEILRFYCFINDICYVPYNQTNKNYIKMMLNYPITQYCETHENELKNSKTNEDNYKKISSEYIKITDICITYLPLLLDFIFDSELYQYFYDNIIKEFFNFNNNFKNMLSLTYNNKIKWNKKLLSYYDNSYANYHEMYIH